MAAAGYSTGVFPIDTAEVWTAEGRLSLSAGIDRTSKFAVARLADEAAMVTARAFLEAPVAAVPDKIEIVPTDSGIQYSQEANHRTRMTAATLAFDPMKRNKGSA